MPGFVVQSLLSRKQATAEAIEQHKGSGWLGAIDPLAGKRKNYPG
jgi:hypothetical protein